MRLRHESRKKRLLVRRGALAVFLSLGQVALPHLPVFSAEAPAEIVIPPELGYVLEVHPPSTNPHPSPTIIHIQEAHANPEAQRHVVGILERLIQDHGLKLILVEGGQGDVGLSYLRDYASTAKRTTVANRYLDAGILSAEEYLDLVSDHPLILWGVEERSLYRQNLEVFLEANTLRQSLEPVVASVRALVERAALEAFSRDLRELLAVAHAFEEGDVALEAYVRFLLALTSRSRMPLGDVPHLTRLLEATALETALQIAERDLPRYLEYLRLRESIDSARVSEELQEVAHRLRDALAGTPERRALLAVTDQVELAQRLLELRLSPEEYAAWQSCCAGGVAAGWAATLFTDYGLPTTDHSVRSPKSEVRSSSSTDYGLPTTDSLDEALPALQRFYELAARRDAAMVERALKKLEATGERLAVLITGGFHAAEIARGLTARGVGLVAVVPKVLTSTDERLYEAVVRYKSGRATEREVFETASQSVVRSP